MKQLPAHSLETTNCEGGFLSHLNLLKFYTAFPPCSIHPSVGDVPTNTTEGAASSSGGGEDA